MSNEQHFDQQSIAKEADARLYVPLNDADNVSVSVKTSSSKEYCFSKFPEQDHYHLLMHGELYVSNGHEMYCLECAIKQGLLTTDRLNWQHQKQT